MEEVRSGSLARASVGVTHEFKLILLPSCNSVPSLRARVWRSFSTTDLVCTNVNPRLDVQIPLDRTTLYHIKDKTSVTRCSLPQTPHLDGVDEGMAYHGYDFGSCPLIVTKSSGKLATVDAQIVENSRIKISASASIKLKNCILISSVSAHFTELWLYAYFRRETAQQGCVF